MAFHTRLKSETSAAHRAAEESPFVDALVRGDLPLDAYTQLLGQLYLVYQSLEDAESAHRDNPVVRPFLDEALLRVPELEKDLRFLSGPAWLDQIDPVPATLDYTHRIRDVAYESNAAFIAHHYIRYMGDLSGGQIIRRALERAYGFTHDGVRFYRFDAIPKVKPFKDAYRRSLDDAPLTPADRDALIAEAISSFALNAAIFADLEAMFLTGSAN
ncbi:biliverdin-producing heme oxygenase [Hoyosella subflava]|uniref:Putative heme oxygenase n=1 Tax=Hoyosella subflava (strain DSM 45089 / JCM 17490 / NBRC 109087 / DQS3-9A1) TaxID=443218 RepID=F6END2_HOYSD|nr:biliverdin-producing heme oxygenase [Hoyosella subflava]AEF40403.1 Putative heme oxygenase [Hoyosella subflava DQS3-9A1]